MQDTRATNPVSPMYGSTTNPMQSGRENCVELDGQSSQQSEHEYINLDDEIVPTQDTNEDPGERDIGNNNGKDELKLKRILEALSLSSGLPNGSVSSDYILPPHTSLGIGWPPRVTLGRLLPHARGLGFKPRREGFPSGAKKEWGLSPKVKVRVLHTAQLDVTVSSNQ
nr:hypothetical protein [Tanacetum cinerariifolium]